MCSDFIKPCMVTVFRLRCLVAFRRYSRSSLGSCPKFDVLGRQISGGGAPEFLTECYKSGSPSNMRQSSVTIDQVTSEIRRRKKTAVKQNGRRPANNNRHRTYINGVKGKRRQVTAAAAAAAVAARRGSASRPPTPGTRWYRR